MKTYYASGTMGDAYIIMCKLYKFAQKQPIVCRHHLPFNKFESIILDIYSHYPSINVELIDKMIEPCLSGHFYPPPYKPENEGCDYKMTYFPKLNFEKVSKNLPEKYNVLQIKSGRDSQARIIPETIAKTVISHNKLPTIILGTDDLFEFKGNIIDLRNKTTVKEAMSIVHTANKFDGFIGLLGYVAVSHKVKCNIYVNNRYDGADKRFKNNPWGKIANIVNVSNQKQ